MASSPADSVENVSQDDSMTLPKISKLTRYYYKHREEILEKKKQKRQENPEYQAKQQEKEEAKKQKEIEKQQNKLKAQERSRERAKAKAELLGIKMETSSGVKKI